VTLLLALLPTVLTVAKWIFEKIGANEETKKAFLKLVESAKNDPAICLKMKVDFKEMEDELKNGGGQ